MSDDTGSTSSSPPGWYPYGEGRQRWWDGEAFGAFAPPAAPPPTPPLRPKPKIGKTAKIVLVASALLYVPVVVVIVIVMALIEPPGDVALNEVPGTVPQDKVISELDGCQRFYYLMLQIQTQNLSNGNVVPRFRGLRDAATASDPQLAAGLDDILESRGSTEISDAMTALMSRCMSTGNVTSEQVDVYDEAVQAQ